LENSCITQKSKISNYFLQEKQKNTMQLIPVFGAALFALLYFIATLYYPGGSQANQFSIGFSWMNNYWCNLLNYVAINGKPNTAKPIAMVALFVLCVSLMFFWLNISREIYFSKTLKLLVKYCGITSMIIAFLLFTNINHDLLINGSSALGCIALIGSFIALYKLKFIAAFRLGLLNMICIVANNILYYNESLIIYLPLVQKISFLLFLLWISFVSIQLYKKK
jgi:hypothetical protein